MDDKKRNKPEGRVTLKMVADQLGFTPGTISAVLNNTPASQRIPQHTKDRIRAAARELNYQPNPLARALRSGQPFTTGADAHETGGTHGALVIMDSDHFLLAMTAIQQVGLRLPDDVSVVELDGIPMSALDYRLASAAHKPT